MEDFGGRNLRENATIVLKKYGPMTSADVASYLTDAPPHSPKFNRIRSTVNSYFKQDIERWGEIEVCDKIRQQNGMIMFVYKWIGN